MLRFSANDAYPPRPLYEVFDPKFWHANYGDGAFFKDKVVDRGRVGAGDARRGRYAARSESSRAEASSRSDGCGDLAPVPAHDAGVGRLSPCHRGRLARLGPHCASSGVRSPLLCCSSGSRSSTWPSPRIAYDHFGLLLITVPVLTVFLLSGLFSLGYEYAMERIEKLRTRRTLERYVSKNLVKEILDNPGSFYSSLKGVRIPGDDPVLRYRWVYQPDGKRRSRSARQATERIPEPDDDGRLR